MIQCDAGPSGRAGSGQESPYERRDDSEGWAYWYSR